MEHEKLEIMERCQAAGCPVTAVFSMREAAEHPHLRERGYIVEVDHERLGTVRDMAAPFRLSDGAGRDRGVAAGRSRLIAARALPLQNVRVANFGWVWAGPVVGQTLAFLGAEVYKIESRARIDINRTLPPFAGGVRDPDRSLQNHAGWAGNGSVSLNLKKPEARELALQLVAMCDVVIENFGPGAMR